MALAIETFSNRTGGSALFKALGHPEAVAPAAALLERLRAGGRVAVYDPLGQAATFAALHDLAGVRIAAVFVQAVERVGEKLLGHAARPVTDLAGSGCSTLLIAAFDAGRPAGHVGHLIPAGMRVETLDALRLPEAMLTDRRTYLAPINFATNFAFFRDAGGHHTQLVTANYWGSYGAGGARLWATLFDQGGRRLATWEDPLPAAGARVTLDSRRVRQRFGLPEFEGQLFLHVLGAAGHDVVKYALDTYGDGDDALSATHDANAWPSDLYAGLPAPRPGETVVLWVQNSHPAPIPPGGVGLSLMGRPETAWLAETVPAFATRRLDVARLWPGARWPDQFEVRAGKHVVRPRYEITTAAGRRRIAHVNVERTDLAADPRLPELAAMMGKGYILAAPVLPPERFSTTVLPTPMSTAQETLPIAALLLDAEGKELARHAFGCLQRSDSVALAVDELIGRAGGRLASGHGHLELVYDFAAGGSGDGWLHAIFRYEDRRTGHAAETSFGSHIFNTPLTWKSEPQSYAGPPPGLSTRLFLRLGQGGAQTFCCLIYPASTPWHPRSATELTLVDAAGRPAATAAVAIPCGGSRLITAAAAFGHQALEAAGPDAHILIRDATCRLFGYQGLDLGESFSLDHMFGF